MDTTLESSQSPLDKAMIDGGIVNNSPATSTYHEMQVVTPAASSVSIQSSSDEGKTSGKTITTPPETPFSGNTESNTRKSAPSLSASSSPTSSCNTPVLPYSFDFLDSIAAVDSYAAAPHPRTYTHQLPTSSIRTPIARKCGRCVTGSEFKTCSQSVCDDCIKNGHGSATDVSIFRARLLEEYDQFPFSIMVNATTKNPATGNAVIGDDSEATSSYDSDATISIASDY
ncbi:uncharacterized protein Bfra_006654 [Botrytis fragariae]|uniref:Uncharacterized protein n=1 Tax=Botrytis fragariae TaxID=1964551 RepID=A0A8H6B570_9HELO|nr:uncharacterized protein Bfra_006654 [Botrytis fragariae]KAF5879445.1 hypothetical protein Bfra_006654 [Botrytis fragariae]